jgi:hypothetical protein
MMDQPYRKLDGDQFICITHSTILGINAACWTATLMGTPVAKSDRSFDDCINYVSHGVPILLLHRHSLLSPLQVETYIPASVMQ